MKKLLLIILLGIMPMLTFSQKLKFSIWAKTTCILETGKMTSKITQHFEDAILENRTLKLCDRKYSLYNEEISHNDFITYKKYDAIDDYNQRCRIIFQKDSSKEPSMRNWIYVIYENNKEHIIYIKKKPSEE